MRRRTSGRSLLFWVCGSLAVAIAVVLLVVFSQFESKVKVADVTCHPTARNGWTFDCRVTGKGEAKGDENFSSEFVEIAERQGNDLNRTYRGVRWYARVTIESADQNSGLVVGQEYDLRGTVTDISGKRVKLTDCVFTAANKAP
jgi:hypothetical protein